MKQTTTLFVGLLISAGLSAQTIQEIATGAGYQRQSFVKLSAGTETQVVNTAWDIAFTVYGLSDAGIFLNESAGSSMGQPLAGLELYEAGTGSFAEQPEEAVFALFPLSNKEKDWTNGAFNEVRDTTNPFDYGWGQYNPTSHAVVGSTVYVIKLRNGQYRKLMIESLAGGIYSIRYANLDGSNEQVKTISKADHAGKTLAYFSFTTGAAVAAEPAGGFDLLYCRYITQLWDPGNMEYIPYAVTGILHGHGAQAAEADNITPSSIQFSDYQDSLKADIDVIGYDWKNFSGTAWVMDTDKAFFLKTADSRVWKLFFVDFEGSTTGKTIMEKTDLGIISAVNTPADLGMEALVYPNPVRDQLYISLDLKAGQVQEGQLRIFDQNGRNILDRQVALRNGFQVLELSAGQWAAGLYSIQLVLPQGIVSLGNVVKQ